MYYKNFCHTPWNRHIKMDVFTLVEGYMNKMFSGVEGMKILLVDRETSGIISLVMSQSRLFEHNVFIVDYLDNEAREEQKNLNCVCLLRPTSRNAELIAEEISNPKYQSYHLMFTNSVRHVHLERIAEADEHEVIKDFQEIYCDFYPLNRSLFSFNEPSMKLYEGVSSNPCLSRVIEGVSSYFFASKRRPAIRYSQNSSNCTIFAKEINNNFDMNSDYFVSRDGSNVPVLLILDRIEDPITPLLTQWTYQSMIHEFFVIKNGRVKMETPTLSTEYVMNFDNDTFYGEQMFSPIWTVAESVQGLVNRYQKLTLQSTNFSSIADMKKFMQDYPEYKRLSQHVNKHVTLASELMKISDKINLRTISRFEQDLVNSSEGAESVWTRLRVILKDPHVTSYHKLRLCMLVLCHVGIHQPLDHLSTFGFSDDDISFLKYFYLTKTSKDQANGLYTTSSATTTSAATTATAAITTNNFMKSWISGNNFPELKDHLTPLTRHIPKLFEILDLLIRDKLSENQFPYLPDAQRHSNKPKEIVVFLLNGASYEEARFINYLNSIYSNVKIVLGSNFIHNNRSFIAEMFNEWTFNKSAGEAG